MTQNEWQQLIETVQNLRLPWADTRPQRDAGREEMREAVLNYLRERAKGKEAEA